MAKIYTWKGEDYDKLPNPLKLDDGSQISPVSEALFEQLGGVITDDGTPTHYEELCDACDQFIAVVLDIQEFIGSTDFLGGIDQMGMLEESEAAQADKLTALTLAQKWAAANTRCNFFADKPDLYEQFHSPCWFYFSWQRYADTLSNK
jgi:hypothetical protein